MADRHVFFKRQRRSFVQGKNPASDFASMLANPFFPEVIPNCVYYFLHDVYLASVIEGGQRCASMNAAMKCLVTGGKAPV